MNTSSSDSPWRKSSYSSGAQSACVEVRTWRKSSYSTGGQSACVEVSTWRKSSFSTGVQGECVEVAAASAVLVRDTTNREGGTLTVPAPAWSAFLATIR